MRRVTDASPIALDDLRQLALTHDSRAGQSAGTAMSDVRHRDLAAGRWHELSLAEQMGNIGSEVSRAARSMAGNPTLTQSALYRALELLDLTLADPRHRPFRSRLREIARTREVLVDFFAGGNQYRSTAPGLQKYFDAFAIAARRR